MDIKSHDENEQFRAPTTTSEPLSPSSKLGSEIYQMLHSSCYRTFLSSSPELESCFLDPISSVLFLYFANVYSVVDLQERVLGIY